MSLKVLSLARASRFRVVARSYCLMPCGRRCAALQLCAIESLNGFKNNHFEIDSRNDGMIPSSSLDADDGALIPSTSNRSNMNVYNFVSTWPYRVRD